MNACAVYDFRYSQESIEKNSLINFLRKNCKKWSFQLEKGDTGYMHFQGRLSLIKKRRKNDLLALFESQDTEKPNYLEPTVSNNMGNNFYATKMDTRVDGPWSDKDQDTYIPKQYKPVIDNLYPFQKAILESASQFDDRAVDIIYCPNGNNGKSTVSALAELTGTGVDLPPINDMEKLMATLCDICMAKELRNPSPICFDLPRALTKDKLYQLFSAIESIKKGHLYDLRYAYKSWWIDSPRIWLFTNTTPDLSLLSRDRWHIWTINEKKELVPYEPTPLIAKKEAVSRESTPRQSRAPSPYNDELTELEMLALTEPAPVEQPKKVIKIKSKVLKFKKQKNNIKDYYNGSILQEEAESAPPSPN